MTLPKGWQGSEHPPCPSRESSRETTSPYLALFEAVFLLGGRDDLQGDGSLGLGLKGEGTEVHGFPAQVCEFQFYVLSSRHEDGWMGVQNERQTDSFHSSTMEETEYYSWRDGSVV